MEAQEKKPNTGQPITNYSRIDGQGKTAAIKILASPEKSQDPFVAVNPQTGEHVKLNPQEKARIYDQLGHTLPPYLRRELENQGKIKKR